MKMFKKLMAVALVGVMALSMLTGCAVKNENDMKKALKLAGQTRGVTVEVDNGKKVDGKKLSAWAEEAANKLDDQAGEDLSGLYPFDDGKILAYVIKEQNSTEKWRNVAGKVVENMQAAAKADENGKYSVSIDTFKAKKAADKSAKNDYVVIVVEAAAKAKV